MRVARRWSFLLVSQVIRTQCVTDKNPFSGLQPIVDLLRCSLPGIVEIGCLSMPSPFNLNSDDLAIACAAVQVYVDRKRRWGADRAVRSTFDMYSERSAADAQTKERRWYLACHLVMHARRAAHTCRRTVGRSRLPLTELLSPQSWRSLYEHRDLLELGHRVRVVERHQPRKRRRLAPSRPLSISSDEINDL